MGVEGQGEGRVGVEGQGEGQVGVEGHGVTPFWPMDASSGVRDHIHARQKALEGDD